MSRVALIVIGILAATACGTGQAAPTRPSSTVATTVSPAASAQATAAPTAIPTAAPAPALALNIVPYGTGAGPGGIYCPKWLVMSDTRSTYTSAEMQQMADFLAQVGIWSDDPPTPPSTLQWTPVSIADPSAPITKYWNEPKCVLVLQMTNTGRSAVQVISVGLKLTASARANADQYHLVEACSIQGAPAYCGIQKGGGATYCDLYEVQVRLSQATSGMSFSGTPTANQEDGSPCPQLTLNPSASVEVKLHITSTQPFVYPVEPIVVVRTAAGTQEVAVASAATGIKFASPSQFDCYRRSGQALVKAWSGPSALDWQALGAMNLFCG